MTKALIAIAVVATLAGCGGHADLDKLRESEIPVWHLGTSFEGLDLTYADENGPDHVLLTYGDCEIQGSDGGCAPPLEITSCAGSDVVVIYAEGSLADHAAKALQPLNDAARRIGRPHAQFNYGDC